MYEKFFNKIILYRKLFLFLFLFKNITRILIYINYETFNSFKLLKFRLGKYN
jgi:hypothetical protein